MEPHQMPAGGSLKMEPIDSLSSAMSPPGTPAPPGSTLSAPPSLTPSLAQLEEHQRQMQQDQFQPIHAESSFGFLAELQDALLIVQLCLTDKLPLVRRRLTPFERESIRSGSIFSFIEASAESSSRMVTPPRRSSSSASATSNAMSKDWQPMRRWTDGLAWSKSRVQGNYLVYREVAEKRSITAKRASSAASSHGHPMSAELVEFHQQQEQAQQKRGTRGRPNAQLPVRPVAKSDGLMKRTFSILVDGNVWHVINYYTEEDVESGLLPTPTSRFPDVKLEARLLDPSKLRLRSTGAAREATTTSRSSSTTPSKGTMRSTSRAPSSQSSASGSVRRISAREALAYQQAQAVAVAAQRQQAIAMASMGLPPSSYSHNGLLHHNGPQSGPSSHMSNGGTHSPTDGPSNGTASINTNGGFITIRQLDPESATIQIPLPQTLRDLRRIATKTFRLTTPHIVLHGPQGEIVDLNFPLLMDGDHIDIQVRKPRIVTAGFMDPTAEAALALTRLASAE